MTSGTAQTKPIDWRNLIQAGQDLISLRNRQGTPTSEHIRRAISCAYYAEFHALAATNADILIGTPRDTISSAAWTRVYRGLDHGIAQRELQRHRQEFSRATQEFTDTFGGLQKLRHSADYDPNVTFTGFQAAVWLGVAEYGCLSYLRADRDEQAYIASLTLVRGR